MNKVIEQAQEQSWNDFSEVTPSFFMGSPSTCQKAHDQGWREGYEWILTELVMKKKITKKTLKKYMDLIS